ncbi:Ger(x)C family spore germination protein [Scatolibacter rhodanostii]|uniref:Ger(x)C family spore germination protein n=1 Tax=Scatolibacter rhodanostii TaxID=2014781 RepID=UPI000C074E26|nr:Ger(x)C family spore germination protein [Scatolibacter rhodanostii]
MKKLACSYRIKRFYQTGTKNRYMKLFLLSFSLVLCLSSCWSQRDISSLSIVIGTALDATDNPEELSLTAQVVKPTEIGSNSGGESSSGGGQAYVNITQSANSMLPSVRAMTHSQSRKLYFAHNEILIFSDELAKTNILDPMDPFTRDYETRMDVQMMISRGKAAEILDQNNELEKLPALYISGMIKNQKYNSETVIVTLRDFLIATLSESAAPIAPIIEIFEEDDGNKLLRLDGTAVFQDGKMIGELDQKETKGLLFVLNQSSAGVNTLETPAGQVVLETLSTKTKLVPVLAEDGNIRMKVQIKENVILQSNETREDMTTLENIKMLEELLAETTRASIDAAVKKAHLLSADIFKFGEAIYIKYPKIWKEMKDQWDVKFSEVGVDVEIDTHVHASGGLTKPILPGGYS